MKALSVSIEIISLDGRIIALDNKMTDELERVWEEVVFV
jgi:hypothetical protein